MRTTADRKHLPGITVDPNMRDYSKEPFFIKKAERARAFIAKHGLPGEEEEEESAKEKPKKSK
jgi:hypothetical protein